MKEKVLEQGISPILGVDDHLESWIESFLYDRKTQNLSPGTLHFYVVKLALFAQYAGGRHITRIVQITPDELRRCLAWLDETGHNAGGRHATFRAIRAFLNWYETEAEPEGWHNPVYKVKAPKLPAELLDPVSLSDVKALEKTCTESFAGLRDKAILLMLLDSGLRAQELLDVDLTDIDLITGQILVRAGKGRKPRTTFIGKRTRRTVRNYLKVRTDKHPALWITEEGDRLTYWGLRSMIARRSGLAGIEAPELHAFRRQFALTMLRQGTDVVTLARLMGHTDLSVLQRYLKQLPEDLQAAHAKASPVDSW